MLASEIKAVSIHYRPLPLDSRVDFFILNNSPPPPPPFEKCIAPGAFIWINTVIQFKIMCIKIVSIMLCANQKNKTMSPYTVHKAV